MLIASYKSAILQSHTCIVYYTLRAMTPKRLRPNGGAKTSSAPKRWAPKRSRPNVLLRWGKL